MSLKFWLPFWLKIGRSNYWISRAVDPAFDERSFSECESLEDLKKNLSHGNWTLGTAFSYGEFCFIQQVDGGDEWLICCGDLSFESCSCGRMIKENKFDEWFRDINAASIKELKELTYSGAARRKA